MTVCQFFMQGRCRFGQNCRFEHTYNNDDRNNRNPVNSQHLSNVIKQIEEEVILAEKGGQWPLSCFSPVKGGPNIPGWDDVSPEEVRWKMYEARANGTLNQCNLEINQLHSSAEKMRNLMKEPTVDRVNLIINVLKGRKEPNNPSNQFTNSSSPSTIFGNSGQSSGTQKIFRSASQTGNHGTIFGGATSTTGNIFGGSSQTTGSIFGNTASFPSQNIFGGSSSSNTFSQNTFSMPPQTTNQNIFSNSSSSGSGNIFSNVSMPSQNIFSKTVENNNQNVSNAFLTPKSPGIFSNQTSGGSIFGSNATFFQNAENQTQNQSSIFRTSPKGNIFNSSNIFNAPSEPSKAVFGGENPNNAFHNNPQTSKQFDSSVYSKLEDLTEEEIKSFTSPIFVFGKIPLKPPLKEYCK